MDVDVDPKAIAYVQETFWDNFYSAGGFGMYPTTFWGFLLLVYAGYLSLKRSIEAADLQPSDAARARLRAAVAQELSAAEPAAWLWWERPLAVAFATVAVVLTTLTVGQF
jgi:hypothetical protein